MRTANDVVRFTLELAARATLATWAGHATGGAFR